MQFLTTDYQQLCELLEPQMSVREKEEFATTLVHAMHKLGKAKGFLGDIVMCEIGRLGQYEFCDFFCFVHHSVRLEISKLGWSRWQCWSFCCCVRDTSKRGCVVTLSAK